MDILLKIRIIKLANPFGLIYSLLLESLVMLGILLHKPHIYYFLIIYFLIPFVFRFKHKKYQNGYAYHIQRGIFITINQILTRSKMMLVFYTFVVCVVYSMSADLSRYKPTTSLIIFAFMYAFKLIVFFMSYKASKNIKEHEDFDQLYI